jgi:hypothetical protein
MSDNPRSHTAAFDLNHSDGVYPTDVVYSEKQETDKSKPWSWVSPFGIGIIALLLVYIGSIPSIIWLHSHGYLPVWLQDYVLIPLYVPLILLYHQFEFVRNIVDICIDVMQ